MNRRTVCAAFVGALLATPLLAQQAPRARHPELSPPSVLGNTSHGQRDPGEQGSANIHILSHIPLGGALETSDIEIEQELSRPYVYQSRMLVHGVDIISVKDPDNAEVIYSWRIDNPELHQGTGGMDNKYFKLDGRYYDVQSFQFGQSGPDSDVGAVVFDVTGLPDTSTIREVGRVRAADTPGGFHNIYAYKHSSGRVLLFATTNAPHVNIYDMAKFLAGDRMQGFIGRVPVPDQGARRRGYHDMYVGYDPATRQDKFYGPGGAGYFVFDVSQPEEPELITSITGAAGIFTAHTFTPTPDGRYAIAEAEYQFAPLRIFDLKPGLDGEVKTISRPIGAWTADWQNLAHNHEVRWPYVFVSAYEDGLQVFNMMDPTNPYTVGFYDTYDGPHMRGFGGTSIFNGAFGIDVRNADGLIVISDFTTGFWAFSMDGFDGWNGHQWGMPNISSAQDWDNGPDGAPAPARVS